MTSTDYSGHALTLTPTWQPRGGQWVLVKLADEATHLTHVANGAHVARNGYLVGIYCPPSFPSPVMVDGKVVTGDPQPARVQLVDSDGNNLVGLRKVPGVGMAAKDVAYHWGSPAIADVKPLADLEDFPPGRARHEGWKPSA